MMGYPAASLAGANMGMGWIPTQPTFKSRCVADAHFFTPREAWLVFQTIRRWYGRGHAARAEKIMRGLLMARVGKIDNITFFEVPPRRDLQ